MTWKKHKLTKKNMTENQKRFQKQKEKIIGACIASREQT